MNWDAVCFNAAAFVAGLFLLEFGADKFIDHTAILARHLGVSQTPIALLTAGAEWEELAVVIAAVIQKRSPLALGNVVGSTISNILGAFSLGLLFLPRNIVFDRSSKIYVALLFLLTTVFVILAYFRLLGRWLGGAMIGVFAIYVISIAYAIYKGAVQAPEDSDDDGDESDSDGDEADTPVTSQEFPEPSETSALLGSGGYTKTDRLERKEPHRLVFHVSQLLLGFLSLSLSGYVLSHSAASLADAFHLSGTVVGLTILSFATTLPEKFVAVLGGSRGHVGIIVANTAGSNIFLLTLCLGAVALSGDLEGHAEDFVVPFELVITWASSALFFFIVFLGLGRWTGVLLLALYVVFLVLEFTLYRR